eukprot:RCo025796
MLPAVILTVYFRRRKKRRLILPGLDALEMAFGATVSRDDAWEQSYRTYRTMLQRHMDVIQNRKRSTLISRSLPLTCIGSDSSATTIVISVAVGVAIIAAFMLVVYFKRKKKRRLVLPSLDALEMAFGATVSRDAAWEQSYRAMLEKYMDVLNEPDALLIAANGLISAGSVNALLFSQDCLAWAQERYPSDVLAVATCRWWT